MGLLYNIFVKLVNFIIFFLLLTLIPGLPPKTDFPFSSIEIKPPRELKGALELNNLLDNAERLLEGRVYGPESLIVKNDEIYTGIHGGEIIKISEDRIRHVAKFGQPCDGIYEESKCGRPLGLAFDTLGDNLIAADAYYGIWQVDLTNGKKTLLVSSLDEFEGTDGKVRKAKIFNSVAVAKNGDIYWTDSSSDFHIEDGIMTAFANPSGRLFHYNRQTNKSDILIDQIYFANGIVLSPKEDFIVVAETMGSRLLKYHLQGPKKGQKEVFVDGLPGLPDNLSSDSEGIWVPLITAADSSNPAITQLVAPYHYLRLFLLRFLALIEIPFRFFSTYVPIPLAQKTLHLIGNFESVNFIQPKRATILRVDWNGNIKGALHGFDKSVGFVSHVLELDDSLLLGSPFNKFLARVKLPRSPQVKIRNVRYEGAAEMEPIVVEQVSKNKDAQKSSTTTTTTTAKPTTTTTTKKSTTSKPEEIKTTKVPVVKESPPTRPTVPPTVKTTQAPATKAPEIKTKPTTTTTVKPTTKNPHVKSEQIPIREEIKVDTKPPTKEKLKIIKKGGEHGEL